MFNINLPECNKGGNRVFEALCAVVELAAVFLTTREHNKREMYNYELEHYKEECRYLRNEINNVRNENIELKLCISDIDQEK